MRPFEQRGLLAGGVVLLAAAFLVIGGGILLAENRSEVPHPTWALSFALLNLVAGLIVGYVGARILLSKRRGDAAATARVVRVAVWAVGSAAVFLVLFYGGIAVWLHVNCRGQIG